MLQRGDDFVFPGEKIGPGKIDAENRVMSDERAVAGQILDKELQLLQHFLFRKRIKFAALCLLQKGCSRKQCQTAGPDQHRLALAEDLFVLFVLRSMCMAEITKMWIADKMREIMKHKPIDKIRVTEICKAADIERPTFYYHFKDKYDLVAWMFCRDAYGTDITSVASAAAGMNRMKQDIIFYRRAYEDASQNALWHYMRQLLGD